MFFAVQDHLLCLGINVSRSNGRDCGIGGVKNREEEKKTIVLMVVGDAAT